MRNYGKGHRINSVGLEEIPELSPFVFEETKLDLEAFDRDRLQTIRREHNIFLWESLKAFEKLSGMPIMLNTSFNPGGEPILNFCAVGLEMLESTGLDLVLIEETLFCRP